MPTVLISFKKSPSGHIMFHGFTGPSDSVTEKEQTGHGSICPQYGPALKKGETIDFSIDVDELPEFDEESLADWIDELFGIEGDDDEEDEGEEGDDQD